MNITSAKRTIVRFIREKAPNGVVIGLSGGIDSSLVAALCVEALGKDKVLGIVMPSEFSSSDDTNDAEAVAKRLDMDCKIVGIDKILAELEQALSADPKNSIALANLAPRARMIVLYYYANSMNRLVVGTGNRSEMLIGYFTKYGDGGVDILPIADLYKHEVRELAKEMGIHEKIIAKPPTAGLWKGQTDEKELGTTYDELDKILAALFDEKKSPKQVAKDLNIAIGKIENVVAMTEKNKHKLTMPPIAKIR
ncbi:MAG: NAD+ synthase [Candidatus Aenigmatarchaeota archaeon]